MVVEDTCGPDDATLRAFQHRLEILHDPTHVCAYSRRQWSDMLTAAGFTVENIQHHPKQHDVADWLARSGCDRRREEAVHQLLTGAAEKTKAHFRIECAGDRAISFVDDKIILFAKKS